MNPEVKEKWVAALRSGKYKQVEGRLRSDTGDSYCCLGVLCDVNNPRQWKSDDGYYVYLYKSTVGNDLLPLALKGELEIDEIVEEFLSNWNDDGIGFDAIADWIEAEL